MRPHRGDMDDLMVLAAWMHYDDGLTHEQIGKRLHLSRVAVTRLLQRARREGLVQIRITRPLPLVHQIQRRLEKRFGLKEAVVVRTAKSPEHTLEALGRAGAEHLNQVLYEGCRLGVGWSRTVSSIAPYVEAPEGRRPCCVNELAGSFLGQEHPYSVSRLIEETLNVPLEPLPVPVVVQSEAAREALLSEASIRQTLENGRRSDVAFVGLGDVGPDCTMVRTGYLTREQIADLQRKGAVGDLLMRYYDFHGRRVPTPLEPRVISLDWESILQIPHVVAMAFGPSKVDAILGALQGGLCHCLITDTETAELVLARAERPSA